MKIVRIVTKFGEINIPEDIAKELHIENSVRVAGKIPMIINLLSERYIHLKENMTALEFNLKRTQ